MDARGNWRVSKGWLERQTGDEVIDPTRPGWDAHPKIQTRCVNEVVAQYFAGAGIQKVECGNPLLRELHELSEYVDMLGFKGLSDLHKARVAAKNLIDAAIQVCVGMPRRESHNVRWGRHNLVQYGAPFCVSDDERFDANKNANCEQRDGDEAA